VIDASVGRAAGPPHTVHPTARNCRQLLLDVRSYDHAFVASPEILREWDKHQSRFGREWRTSMIARRRICKVEAEEDPHLRLRVQQTRQIAWEVTAMDKDLHLIEAALDADRIVISLDETVRALFDHAAQAVVELREVCWCNPDQPSEAASTWIASGAKWEYSRRLGG
jgi:hypothetical protein